ncbi:GreA/GreB family elongation factor [Nocardia sp. NPDC003345]
MTTGAPIWLTQQAHDQLRSELAELLTVDATGGHDTTDPDDRITARHRRLARIAHIRDLLTHAVFGEDPPDDGIAEPGMVLTVRYDGPGDTETFLLGDRDAANGDLEVYSPDSPLGAALTGARRGEQRTYRVPNGAEIRVTLLEAVPYSRTVADAR